MLRYIHKVYIVLTKKKKIAEGGERERRTVINRVPPGRSEDDASNTIITRTDVSRDVNLGWAARAT